MLVVEDVEELRDLVRTYLEADGYEVILTGTARGALEACAREAPDVVLLDLRLPDGDGLEVLRELRKTRNTPVMVVSSRSEDFDRIVGLEMGADDYLTKPFNPRELVARVKAMFRRLNFGPAAPPDDGIVRGPLRINLAGQRVTLHGQEVALTPKEFLLLRALAERPGRVLSRQELLDLAWGPEFAGDERTVDTHVRNLRGKLLAVAPTQLIYSVWGVGYRFEV